MVADLRDVSEDLLEPGLAKPLPVGATGGHGPLLRALLSAADRFVGLMPRLMADLGADDEGVADDWYDARVPRHAAMPLAPHDYALNGETPVPVRWVRREPAAIPSESAIRWALYVAEFLINDLNSHDVRLTSRLAESLMVRAGDGEWAQHDAQLLRGMSSSVRLRIASVRQAATVLRRSAGRHIAPSSREPFPFPSSMSWQRLKHLARALLHPESMLAMVLNELLSEPISVADVPFLYQRWCGLQLVVALERQAWRRRGDLVGALFLGGRVEFERHDAANITIWVEPRVSSATMPMTGWGVQHGKSELTPDFLITCGAPGMRDAFVLDATLARSEQILASKARYLFDIVGVDSHFIAGVPVPRRPIRAWAIAPLGGSHCRLSDPEGRTGGVPLHPGERDMRALDAWIADVSLHARRQHVGERP